MEPAIIAPKKRTAFRSWDTRPGEDHVQMPRALALDLIRLVEVSLFLFEASEEEAEAQLHEARWEAHKERMRDLAGTLSIHMCDEGLIPTADLMLRALVMTYDTAPMIPQAGQSVESLPATA